MLEPCFERHCDFVAFEDGSCAYLVFICKRKANGPHKYLFCAFLTPASMTSGIEPTTIVISNIAAVAVACTPLCGGITPEHPGVGSVNAFLRCGRGNGPGRQ